MKINLFYQYSKYFLYIAIIILLISIVSLLITTIKIAKESKPLILKTQNLSHNLNVTKNKLDKTKTILNKVFVTIKNVLKYGLLTKFILREYKKTDTKSIKNFSKITRNQIRENNQRELLHRLARK